MWCLLANAYREHMHRQTHKNHEKSASDGSGQTTHHWASQISLTFNSRTGYGHKAQSERQQGSEALMQKEEKEKTMARLLENTQRATEDIARLATRVSPQKSKKRSTVVLAAPCASGASLLMAWKTERHHQPQN